MKQFEINGGVKKAINDYLLARGTDLKTAMDSESANGEIASINHNGPPPIVWKIYSLE